ncbi:MAG: DUF434 domain-containing protein [Thermodesulfobacteriota bacterium]
MTSNDYPKEFYTAAKDLRYLLGQGYPRQGVITFVGNHYQLSKTMRDILYRGVYPGAEALTRRWKMLTPDRIRRRAVGVDGHNVLITLESALLDRDLIVCDDGVIRDVAWISHSYQPSETTEQALDLLLDFLAEHGVLSIVFYLFGTMSFSGELAAQIRSLISGRGLMGRAEVVAFPTEELRGFPGLTASSNSILIDRVAEPIDLAGWIIRRLQPAALTNLGLLDDDDQYRPERPLG